MLIDSSNFLREAYKLGCRREDFEYCANRITLRNDELTKLYAHGQHAYFMISLKPEIQLQVVVSPRNYVLANPVLYAELFDVIKQLAH